MELKPLRCPFCGGPARTYNYNGATQATCAGKFAECAGFDVAAPVAMWNRRPEPAAQADCPVCNGSGRNDRGDNICICSVCGGSGRLTAFSPPAPVNAELAGEVERLRSDVRSFVASLIVIDPGATGNVEIVEQPIAASKYHALLDIATKSLSNAPSNAPRANKVMLAALLNVRSIITEAAATGFNHKDGDWAERLFASQAITSEAVALASNSPPAPAADKAKSIADQIELAAARAAVSNVIIPSAAPPPPAQEGGWRDDPSADERWNAGLDFGLTQLCHCLNVEPNSINWDAATETLDGDVCSVICNILRAKFGDDFDGTAPPGSSPARPEPVNEQMPMPTSVERFLSAELDAVIEVLRGYEKWEADLIMSADAWAPHGMAQHPRLTQELWDALLALQARRIAALKFTPPKEPGTEQPAAEDAT